MNCERIIAGAQHSDPTHWQPCGMPGKSYLINGALLVGLCDACYGELSQQHWNWQWERNGQGKSIAGCEEDAGGSSGDC